MATPNRIRLPRLPNTVFAPNGPVQVIRKLNLVDEKDDAKLFGCWVPSERAIYLEKKLTLSAAWPVLFHEQFHAWLDDIGIAFPDDQVPLLERFCDGLGHCRTAEMYEQLRKRKH